VDSCGFSFWRGGRIGGGFVACRTGDAGVCRGGRLGDDVLAGLAGTASTRLTGGFGRWSVLNPVVSFLYGSGGGFGTSSSASCCCLREDTGTGNPFPSCAEASPFPLLALPPYPVCFGGGPKVSGSRRVVKGVDW